MLRGVVHDPTARRMGGVAGHAGLFSTAADLAIFCRMLLNGGSHDGVRILSPLAVEKMITPSTPDLEPTRAGSDGTSTRRSRRTAASCCRSDRSVTPGSPARRSGSIRRRRCSSSSCRTAFIPDGKGDVTPLRARVATVAASAVTSLPTRQRGEPVTGRDFGPSGRRARTATVGSCPERHRRARAEGFAPLRGKRVGLVTNHTGVARDGATTIDLLFSARRT